MSSSVTPVVQVIGYRTVSPQGSSGGVAVYPNSQESVAVVHALADLHITKVRSECHEGTNAFSVRFLPRKGSVPTLTASEYDCPSPGVVVVTETSGTYYFREDCALYDAVVAALPQGRADGTRHDRLAHCAS